MMSGVLKLRDGDDEIAGCRYIGLANGQCALVCVKIEGQFPRSIRVLQYDAAGCMFDTHHNHSLNAAIGIKSMSKQQYTVLILNKLILTWAR